MVLPIFAIIVGLVLLVWSADRFVDGASSTARHYGMPTLLIGMLIVGFGTSAPEIVVSVLASIQGNGGIAIGNAFGSNIANIALILGVTAALAPIVVESKVLKMELPILAVVTVAGTAVVFDGQLDRWEGIALLIGFAGFLGWSVWTGTRNKKDALVEEVEQELVENQLPLRAAIFWLIAGLVLMVVSSRILVWGAVEVASSFGVSDLIIGLTIVAVGTSLPELASSIAAVRKGEGDLALGNVIGSNLFNTLAVVGLAGTINPLKVGSEAFWRDGMVMIGLTLSMFLFSYGFRGRQGQINRWEGATLLAVFVGYTGYLVTTAF